MNKYCAVHVAHGWFTVSVSARSSCYWCQCFYIVLWDALNILETVICNSSASSHPVLLLCAWLRQSPTCCLTVRQQWESHIFTGWFQLSCAERTLLWLILFSDVNFFSEFCCNIPRVYLWSTVDIFVWAWEMSPWHISHPDIISIISIIISTSDLDYAIIF